LRSNLETLHEGTSAPIEPLVDLLKHVATDSHYTTMVNIEVETNLTADSKLSPVQSGHVMRIVSESMSKVLRHALARTVRIIANRDGEALRIEIKDDGNGIIPSSSVGYGLQNMRDRARQLNGALEINSQPGKGTQVVLEIPWKDS